MGARQVDDLVRSAGPRGRRSLLAGAAALVGAGLAKLTSPGRVNAGHNNSTAYLSEGVVHVDQINTTADVTRLEATVTSLPTFSSRNASFFLRSFQDGVQGNSGSASSLSSGVRGHHDGNGIGVTGQANTAGCGVYGTVGGDPSVVPPSGTGVYGRSENNTGVYGISTNGGGVVGVTSSNSEPAIRGLGTALGVGGVGTGTGTGVRGETTAGFGLSGVATSGIGLSGSTSSNVGVFGSADVPGAIGAIGLVGRSGSGTGIVGQGATAARFDGPVIVNGSFTVAGGPKSAAVRHPDGDYRRMYCQESPEPWFEDFGTADLRDGRAEVALDPEFDALVKDDDYLVFLTELGDCGGLYISKKHSHSFEVRSRAGASVNGAFDFRVVSRRRDEVGRRMEKITLRHGKLGEPLKLTDLPPQVRIPDLPRKATHPDVTPPPAADRR